MCSLHCTSWKCAITLVWVVVWNVAAAFCFGICQQFLCEGRNHSNIQAVNLWMICRPGQSSTQSNHSSGNARKWRSDLETPTNLSLSAAKAVRCTCGVCENGRPTRSPSTLTVRAEFTVITHVHTWRHTCRREGVTGWWIYLNIARRERFANIVRTGRLVMFEPYGQALIRWLV